MKFLYACLIAVGIVMSPLALTAQEAPQDLSKMEKSLFVEIFELCDDSDHGVLLSCFLHAMDHTFDENQREKFDLSQIKEAIEIKATEQDEQLQNPVQMTKESLMRGEVFFRQSCQVCHGVKGDGENSLMAELGRKVDLTSSRLNNYSDGQLMQRISKGMFPMPAFGNVEEWTKTDIWNVINYLRSIGKKE